MNSEDQLRKGKGCHVESGLFGVGCRFFSPISRLQSKLNLAAALSFHQ